MYSHIYIYIHTYIHNVYTVIYVLLSSLLSLSLSLSLLLLLLLCTHTSYLPYLAFLEAVFGCFCRLRREIYIFHRIG